jgi:LacI family transcriptional regulator
VILCWANNDDEKLKALVDELDIPIVQLGMADRHSRHNFVSVDYFGAGRTAAEHVIDLLPGPFVTISEQCSHDFPRRQLIAGFQDRLLQERNERVIFLSLDDASAKLPPLQLGRNLMERYLADHLPTPRCIFGIGDLVAIGAMQVCMEHGLRVPEDVTFIGATGLDASHVCSPTLAHLHQPMDELGQAAVELILDMYDQETCWLPGRVLPVQWGDGQSIAHH